MSDFQSILPPNRTSAEEAMERAIWATKPDLSPIPTLMSPDNCPVKYLDWLAWSLSVDEWQQDWPEARKRDVLRMSLVIHRRKGTIGAVKLALASMGYGEAHVHEFRDEPTFDGLTLDSGAVFSEPMRWFHYAITLDQPISAEMAASIKRRLDAIAPIRSMLTYVRSNIIATVFDGIAFDAGHTFDEIYKFEEVENV
ncbi:phage tail protein I [Aliiroseovarius crassostreae]|uniref:phage tail protein I n=1 Tax=Aliiroseovarius crassostreae TaxID=154981 RepID=UPI0021AEDF98|nr:phage tail protein I [Aliiroseovarius crassostreae]UWQ00856.1 phage tail protein I [Aliiroseovarius crassostreae]